MYWEERTARLLAVDAVVGFSLVISCPSLRWLMVTMMVDCDKLVQNLIGQLGPDRDVTIFMDGKLVQSADGCTVLLIFVYSVCNLYEEERFAR